MGDVSAVFPAGVSHLADMPYTWFDSLRMALTFLSIEELEEDERPDRSIWLEGDLMKEHWANVKLIRERKYGVKKDGMDDWQIDGPSQDNSMLRDLGVKK